MDSQQYLGYFLHLILTGIPADALPSYELSRATYDRLINYIALTPVETAKFTATQCPELLWIETADGVHLMVSREDIDMLRLFTQLSSTPAPEPPRQQVESDSDEENATEYDETTIRGQVEIYLRGRPEPIVTSTLDEPTEIAQYFPLMDDLAILEMYLKEEGEFIFFTDDDGEEVGVRLDQLVLMVAHPGSLDFEFMEVEY